MTERERLNVDNVVNVVYYKLQHYTRGSHLAIHWRKCVPRCARSVKVRYFLLESRCGAR